MNKIKKVILPKDNGPHNYAVEWWYFNGYLHNADGKEYSFMDCFFKVDYEKAKVPHILPHLIEDRFKNGKYICFAHSIISDIQNKKSYKEIQNISLVSKDSFKKDLLFIKYKNAHIIGEELNGEITETTPNDFNIKTKNINLDLKSNKVPLLEGGHGYVGTPKAGSYYYSLTNMSAKGELYIKGKKISVKGKAWMDHQWANAVYKKDKWTWFSFQLDNDMEIMCVEYEGSMKTDILIDIIDKNGVQKQYKKAKLNTNGKFWKSKKSNATYPLSWKIEIQKANITIYAEAIIKNQEMIFGQINYWEGPIKVMAVINGKKIKGKGFMELVGYPSDYNYLFLKGGEIKKDLLGKIKKIIN